MPKPLDPDDMPPWIASLWPRSRRPANIIAGVNDDDCAVMKWKAPYLVITTDFLNANPMALQLGLGGPWDLGRLLVASNVSDLCGSGATPVALLVGLTLPAGATEGEFKDVMRGVRYEACRCGIPVVGGDSKLGKSPALLAVAVGSAKRRRQLFLKNGARPGDRIWVSGEVGSAAAAVWGYRHSDLGKDWKAWARRAILDPNLPLAKSRGLARRSLGRGGTDISDGLGRDLAELCRASGVGAIIEAEAIPVTPEVRDAARVAGVPPWTFAFASGGDFQFVVTTSKYASRTARGLGFHEIGTVKAQAGCRVLLSSGCTVRLAQEGHRDRRGLSFSEEIGQLIRDVCEPKLGN